jgi:hypothetical protein
MHVPLDLSALRRGIAIVRLALGLWIEVVNVATVEGRIH